MMKLLRRLFVLAMVGGAGYGGYATWQRRREPRPDGPAEWPPISDATPAPVTMAPRSNDDRRWVEPIDGACPPGYPIKANDNSGIYHVPGGRFYERTVPERCYASEADAVADGYRRSKA